MYVIASGAFRESLDGSTICTTFPCANHTRPSEEYAAELKTGRPARAPSDSSRTRICTIESGFFHHRLSSESGNSTIPQSVYSHQLLSLSSMKEVTKLHGRPFFVVMRCTFP